LSFGYWCTNFLVVQRAMAAKNMGAARRTPLIAAVPKMLFPALVILPGMIAVALTSMPNKDYRIPPPILSEEVYTKAAVAVKNAATMEPAAAFKAVGDAIGKKMNEQKVAALVKDAATMNETQIKKGLYNAIAEYDYDGVILSLVKKYCPTGLLGLALTALLASFMSGMAGNVTAFNTVWTYDLYQAYMAPNKSDQHYFWMGQAITVVGILLSIACAYFAAMYNNAMDIIQLVFGFVNAPLFATFLLGMFWARTTGTGAFIGLFGGIGSSALFHALTIAEGNAPGVKGGYLSVVRTFPSEMAQNFWLASFAFTICFVLTLVISLATKRTKTNEELKGLVYSLTPKLKDEEQQWYLRPAVVGVILLIGCVILNFIFW
jgi:solute:Na+ symporter, SSS family